MNNNDIVHELIDNEVIVANIKTGNYYSIHGVGTTIWQLVQLGLEHTQIINEIVKKYPAQNTEQTRTTMHDFLAELQKEQITFNYQVYKYDKSLHHKIIDNLPDAFSPPELEKFTDMQAILQVDPIHEVDLKGWPNEKK